MRMVIAEDGHVGIGVTDPAEKLHVDGKGVFTERVQVGEFGTTTSTTSGVNVYDNGAVYIRRTNDNPIFRGYDNSGSQVNPEIDNLGGAFRGNVGIPEQTRPIISYTYMVGK